MSTQSADPFGPTPLERQQLNVVDASAHTFWHWVRFELVAAEAQRRGANTIVDVGAGSGMLGDWLAAHHPNISYRFTELSPALDEALGQRFGDDARRDANSPLDASSLVTMLDVIEHIDDDVAALRDLRRTMAAGSTIVVTVPALHWAFSSWDSELGHFRRYSRKQLSTTLRSAGFNVESAHYLFPEMLPLLPIRKLRRAPRTSVDFPALSPLVNRIGYAISSLTSRVRRVWPAGTSVIAVARVGADE